MDTEYYRHILYNPESLRKEFSKPYSPDTPPMFRDRFESLNKRHLPTGEPRPRITQYWVKDRKPFLWALLRKDRIDDYIRDYNSMLFFIHSDTEYCDMTDFDDHHRETAKLMMCPDDQGVFHCVKCKRPMGQIHEFIIAKDRLGKVTLVFNGKELDYVTQAVKPLIDFENEEYYKEYIAPVKARGGPVTTSFEKISEKMEMDISRELHDDMIQELQQVWESSKFI